MLKQKNIIMAMLLMIGFTLFIVSCELQEQSDDTDDTEEYALFEQSTPEVENTTETENWTNESREPEMAIPDEELALELGKLILIGNYPFVAEENQVFEVRDEGEYWKVFTYPPPKLDADGNIISYSLGGGTRIMFRKSDGKIIDLWIDD